MGGAGRTHVRPYATGFYRTPDTTDANLIDEALLYAEQGFTGMKVKVGFGVGARRAADPGHPSGCGATAWS